VHAHVKARYLKYTLGSSEWSFSREMDSLAIEVDLGHYPR